MEKNIEDIKKPAQKIFGAFFPQQIQKRAKISFSGAFFPTTKLEKRWGNVLS